MAEQVHDLQSRLLRRRCVACGYDGSLLRAPSLRSCPRCTCDLTQRPARSYAEMEGLIGQPIRVPVTLPQRVPTPNRLIERWLLFAFLALLFIITIAGLAAELSRDLG